MNLPNKLTMLRIFMIPIFIVFMEINIPYHYLFAFLTFVIACLTDTLDGYIARRDNLITNFGKLMDPLADKLLVMSAMICLNALHIIPTWVVVLILSREFLVTSIRLIAASNGKVIAADKWGKMKTISQMIWLNLSLIYIGIMHMETYNFIGYICDGLMYITIFFTVFSGYNYIRKNLDIFKD